MTLPPDETNPYSQAALLQARHKAEKARIDAAAKALFLNAPSRRELPVSSLPADWWEQVPKRTRDQYLDDARVALQAAKGS